MLLMEEPAPRGDKHLFQASLAGQITALVLAARSRNQGLGAGRFAISWSLESLIGIGFGKGKRSVCDCALGNHYAIPERCVFGHGTCDRKPLVTSTRPKTCPTARRRHCTPGKLA